MKFMAGSNGKPRRLSERELAQLTRPAQEMSPEQRRRAVERATSGLRFPVRVTPAMYGRSGR